MYRMMHALYIDVDKQHQYNRQTGMENGRGLDSGVVDVVVGRGRQGEGELGMD